MSKRFGGMIERRLLLLAMLIGAVSPTPAADLAGRYSLQNAGEVGSELVLKPDGNFEYMLAYGAADYWAKGTWRSQNGVVILNSADEKQEPAFRLLRSSSSKSGMTRVSVLAPNGRPVPNIDVVVESADGKAEARTDSEGVASFPSARKPRSLTFRIRVYRFEAGPFELNPAHDDFYFEINGNAITQVRFKDERLAVEGETLVMRFWNKDQPMRYIRR